MNIDFSQVLNGLDGKPMKYAADAPETLRGKSMTLGGVAQTALCSIFQSETPTGEEKVERWKLAMKISDGEVAVKLEEAALIKKLIAMAYGPLIVGQAWGMLEKEAPPKDLSAEPGAR